MTEDVKEFIEENINLIETNKWEEIYSILVSRIHSVGTASLSSIKDFTEVMLEAGINPLEYISYVPEFYLHRSNVQGKFVIPNNVKHIDGFAFANCSSLTNITIPDSVTSIGEGAFNYCRSLTNVTIGDSVKSIGNYAFEDCSSLTNIVIPDSVEYIGGVVFGECQLLKEITYIGTKKEWRKIKKGGTWRKFSGIEVIRCTDGDIKLK